jgi:hypothetical protein
VYDWKVYLTNRAPELIIVDLTLPGGRLKLSTKYCEEVTTMRNKRTVLLLLFGVFFLLVASPVIYAADYPKAPGPVKIAGAKMPVVTFSHPIHVEKGKVECAKCHHKDADSPKACTTCHGAEAKGSAPAAKDAFHTRCQGCHKDAAAKGASAPTKCNECHKK